jgi:hypothetical protein
MCLRYVFMHEVMLAENTENEPDNDQQHDTERNCYNYSRQHTLTSLQQGHARITIICTIV